MKFRTLECLPLIFNTYIFYYSCFAVYSCIHSNQNISAYSLILEITWQNQDVGQYTHKENNGSVIVNLLVIF